MYIEENYTKYDHIIGAYSKLSHIYILILYLEEEILAQYVQSNRQRDIVESLQYAPLL